MSIMVARGLVSYRVAPMFQKAGKVTSERIKRIGRAEGMKNMREEMRKVKNMRLKMGNRDYNIRDFGEIEVKEVKRREASRRMDGGVLRSDEVSNRLVQNKGARVQVVGSDVEALYPSLEAVEVAEIVYSTPP